MILKTVYIVTCQFKLSSQVLIMIQVHQYLQILSVKQVYLRIVDILIFLRLSSQQNIATFNLNLPSILKGITPHMKSKCKIKLLKLF